MTEIHFKMLGTQEALTMLASLEPNVKRVAFVAFAEYMIGDGRHGFSYEPPRVQHGEGNPYQWQSEKQRKAYFASDGFGGGIPYNRTHQLANNWTYAEPGANSIKLMNNSNSASFVFGDDQQRGHAADGWRHVLSIISDNLTGAYNAAQNAVNEWIRNHA